MRKMGFFKKTAAMVLAAAMVITVAPNVNAAGQSGSVTGDSYMEGVMPTDVVDVVLPTVTNDTYKFILDPADLLSRYDANSSKYTKSSVYFTNAGGTYTGTSDIATATNKSTCDVVLGVDVSVANVATNPVTFTDSASVATGTDRNLYIGLVPTAKGTVADNATPEAGALKDAKAKAVTNGTTGTSFLLTGTTNNFDVKQTADANTTSGHAYNYVAKTTGATWTTAGFALTGACNTGADWSAFNTASQDKTSGENLQITVAYSMDVPSAAQKEELATLTPDGDTGEVALTRDVDPVGFTKDSYDVTLGTALDIPVDLGKGSKAIDVTSAMVELELGGTWYDLSSFGVTYADGKVTVAEDTTLTAGGPYTVRLTFNGDSSLAFTTTFTVAS